MCFKSLKRLPWLNSLALYGTTHDVLCLPGLLLVLDASINVRQCRRRRHDSTWGLLCKLVAKFVTGRAQGPQVFRREIDSSPLICTLLNVPPTATTLDSAEFRNQPLVATKQAFILSALHDADELCFKLCRIAASSQSFLFEEVPRDEVVQLLLTHVLLLYRRISMGNFSVLPLLARLALLVLAKPINSCVRL